MIEQIIKCLMSTYNNFAMQKIFYMMAIDTRGIRENQTFEILKSFQCYFYNDHQHFQRTLTGPSDILSSLVLSSAKQETYIYLKDMKVKYKFISSY